MVAFSGLSSNSEDYLIDTKLGRTPFGFHLTNVVFHSLMRFFFTYVLSRESLKNLS